MRARIPRGVPLIVLTGGLIAARSESFDESKRKRMEPSYECPVFAENATTEDIDTLPPECLGCRGYLTLVSRNKYAPLHRERNSCKMAIALTKLRESIPAR